MTLKEFVSETLTQVIQGVQEAKQKHSAHVAPEVETMGDGPALIIKGRPYAPAFLVDFDVAITASERKEAGGEGGISVVDVFKVGGKKTTENETSTVSRVKFSVPVTFH